MIIYLAARYNRHPEMQKVAHKLLELGHSIGSRWIWGNHQVADNGLDPLSNKDSRIFAVDDFEDLKSSELVISFTEGSRVASRGGRHVEFCLALALNKLTWIVGPRENVFHCLPQVQHFASLDGMLQHLKSRDDLPAQYRFDSAHVGKERPCLPQ